MKGFARYHRRMARRPRSRSPAARRASEIWNNSAVKVQIEEELHAIGERLRAVRFEVGLSQESAAERIGIHPKHLQRAEHGGSNVTVGTLVAAAIGYGVPVIRFFQPLAAARARAIRVSYGRKGRPPKAVTALV